MFILLTIISTRFTTNCTHSRLRHIIVRLPSEAKARDLGLTLGRTKLAPMGSKQRGRDNHSNHSVPWKTFNERVCEKLALLKDSGMFSRLLEQVLLEISHIFILYSSINRITFMKSVFVENTFLYQTTCSASLGLWLHLSVQSKWGNSSLVFKLAAGWRGLKYTELKCSSKCDNHSLLNSTSSGLIYFLDHSWVICTLFRATEMSQSQTVNSHFTAGVCQRWQQ